MKTLFDDDFAKWKRPLWTIWTLRSMFDHSMTQMDEEYAKAVTTAKDQALLAKVLNARQLAVKKVCNR